MRVIDLSGRRFGRLTVIERAGSDSQASATWHCLCDCGESKEVSGHHLRRGAVKSCGCLRAEVLAASGYKHGGSYTPTWNVWRGMLKRCNSPNCPQYKYYGARGIKVCDRWSDYAAFLEDMGERPNGASIERLDVNGNYEPGNCEWIPLERQPDNTTRTIKVSVDGEEMCLREACRKLGLKYTRVRDRVIKLGWSFERAISEPKKINGTVYAEEVGCEIR